MQGTFFEYSIHYVVILLQPRKLLKEESIIRMLAGAGEMFQKALRKNLSRTTSILIGTKPVPFRLLFQEFKVICDQAVWLNEEELTFRKLDMDEEHLVEEVHSMKDGKPMDERHSTEDRQPMEEGHSTEDGQPMEEGHSTVEEHSMEEERSVEVGKPMKKDRSAGMRQSGDQGRAISFP